MGVCDFGLMLIPNLYDFCCTLLLAVEFTGTFIQIYHSGGGSQVKTRPWEIKWTLFSPNKGIFGLFLNNFIKSMTKNAIKLQYNP